MRLAPGLAINHLAAGAALLLVAAIVLGLL
jgi:hypothetical protein